MSRGAVAIRRGLPSAAGVGAPSDRRFRRAAARPARRSWKRVAARASLVTLLGLAAVATIAVVGSAILHAPALAVSRIVVRGTARLSNEEVEALLDGLRGQSILLADFDDYARRLMASPWVAGATLTRVLPSTVVVDVEERGPMAIARLGSQLYLVDERGVIIAEYGPEYRQYDLPVVDGLVRAASGGTFVDDAGVGATRQFLQALRARPELRQRVSQLDVTDPRDVVVLLDDDAARLHVGGERFVERLSMYLMVADALRAQVPDIDDVDLRFDDVQQIPIRSRSRDR